MTKQVQEALQIIENVRRAFNGTGVEHDTFRQAVQIIVVALNPKKEPEEVKVPKKALSRDRKRKKK